MEQDLPSFMPENYATKYYARVAEEETQYVETTVRDTPPISLSLKLIPTHQQKRININTRKIQQKQL